MKLSMDGKRRFLENIFVERLWRSLKYECVYLRAWTGGRAPQLEDGWTSTITGGHIPLLADARPMLFPGVRRIRSNPAGRHDL